MVRHTHYLLIMMLLVSCAARRPQWYTDDPAKTHAQWKSDWESCTDENTRNSCSVSGITLRCADGVDMHGAVPECLERRGWKRRFVSGEEPSKSALELPKSRKIQVPEAPTGD